MPEAKPQEKGRRLKDGGRNRLGLDGRQAIIGLPLTRPVDFDRIPRGKLPMLCANRVS
jgi:hypothetical protein